MPRVNQQKARPVLGILAAAPAALTAGEVTAQMPAGTKRAGVTTALGQQETHGRVRRAGQKPGAPQMPPQVLWEITGAGLRWLAGGAGPNSPGGPELRARVVALYGTDDEDGLRAPAIARLTGLNVNTVYSYLHQAGVQLRPAGGSNVGTRGPLGRPDVTAAECARMYEAGMSTAGIGATFDPPASHALVSRRLAEAGVEMRRRGPLPGPRDGRGRRADGQRRRRAGRYQAATELISQQLRELGLRP